MIISVLFCSEVTLCEFWFSKKFALKIIFVDERINLTLGKLNMCYFIWIWSSEKYYLDAHLFNQEIMSR